MSAFASLLDAFMRQALPATGNARLQQALTHWPQLDTAGGARDGLRGLLQQGIQTAAQSPLHTGGLGALAGSLLGGGRGALGGGALALLASLALQALSTNQAAAPAQPVADTQTAQDHQARLILKGMIQAAKADGHLDAQEMQRIVERAASAGNDPELQQWLWRELAAPVDIAALAAEIPSPEVAAMVYAASLLAIAVDTDAERAHLRALAQACRLSPATVAHLHRSLGVADI